MIEKWLQVTCDDCGEVDNSVAPNMTVAEFRDDLRQWGWRFRDGRDLCGMCYELWVEAEKKRKARL